MSNGLFNSKMTAVDSWDLFYTIPATLKVAKVYINVCNTSQVTVTVQVAITSANSPLDKDIIEMVVLPANGGILIRECEFLSADEKIFIKSSASIPVRVSGLEFPITP